MLVVFFPINNCKVTFISPKVHESKLGRNCIIFLLTAKMKVTKPSILLILVKTVILVKTLMYKISK